MGIVLIIEDDALLQSMYKERFSAEGIEVVQAEDGKTGLLLAKERRPNVVVLDIMLPGDMDGFEILKLLKADPETMDIPVVVLTNLDGQEKVAESTGAEDYIIKSNTPFFEVVEKVKERAN